MKLTNLYRSLSLQQPTRLPKQYETLAQTFHER